MASVSHPSEANPMISMHHDAPASSFFALSAKTTFAISAVATLLIITLASGIVDTRLPQGLSFLFVTPDVATRPLTSFDIVPKQYGKSTLGTAGVPVELTNPLPAPHFSLSKVTAGSYRRAHILQFRNPLLELSQSRDIKLSTASADLPFGASEVNRDGTLTKKAWTMFFPALIVAIMGKVTIFFSHMFRGAQGLLRAHHHHHHPANSAEEGRKANLEACKRVAILGVLANLMLFVMQAITGFAGNSAGLIAKAVDSFGDLMADGVSYLSIKQAHRPPDSQHQFGHGKFESLGALSIATLLLIAAWEAGTESLEALEHARESGTFEGPSMFALYGAAASIVIKEALYRIMMAVGKATNSDSTMANANHHRMDGFASIIVFVGIIGARLGCRYADPVAGIFVAAIILKAAYNIAAEAFNDLTDGIPNLEDMDLNQCLLDAISHSTGVVKYDNLRSRKMGPFIALHFDLYVDPSLSVKQVAEVEDSVRQHVLQQNRSITDIGIRILPAMTPVAVPAMAV